MATAARELSLLLKRRESYYFLFLCRIMDFQAVIESLDKNREQQAEIDRNPYNALFPPTLVRKPTLTNLVQQLKQQSSKTRFVKQYRKLSTSADLETELPIQDNGKLIVVFNETNK